MPATAAVKARHRLAAGMRRHPWLLGLVVVLAIGVAVLDSAVDEPVRRFLESGANARLKGYRVRLPGADFRPWSLALQLEGLEFRQAAHPEPPVAVFPAATLGVEWRSLLRGRIVADLLMVRPVLRVDTAQLATEDRDAVEFEDRGWQRLLELYPLQVNTLRIRDGTLAYRDAASKRDLRFAALELTARNIRHVAGGGERFPSPLRVRATVFADGEFSFDGRADFLSRPHLSVYGVIRTRNVPLSALGPVVDDYRVRLTGGVLDARGQVEVRPENYIANLDFVDVRQLKVDVVSGAPTADTRRAREVAVATARVAGRSPEVRLRMRELRVRGDLGWVSDTAPEYRLFLSGADLRVDNLSNRAAQGETRFSAAGLFMGSGVTRARGVWQPGAARPRFAVDARIENTLLPSLNDLLRANGRLDVGAGVMSVYTELEARDGRLRGYVKPLFRDVDVLSAEDRGENPFHQLYEAVAEAISNVLQNRERDEVATVAELSGNLDDPDVSGWDVFVNLLRNAFVQAILPGFDRERDGRRRES